MSKPLYRGTFTEGLTRNILLSEDQCFRVNVVLTVGWCNDVFERLKALQWDQRTEARKELFMSDPQRTYVYGKGENARTYTSIPYQDDVLQILNLVNLRGWNFNAVFLNRYDTEHNQLGWHADDSPGQDFDHPIGVVSLGAEREIWWRPNGQTGVVPPEQRQLLEHGSLFLMPPGFQQTHQHRVPKCGKPTDCRISLTLRKFL